FERFLPPPLVLEHFLTLFVMYSLTVLLFTSLCVVVSSDYSQLDCQPNEVFITCGQCEGTCGNPRPLCEKKCRGVRCECIAVKGFVRSKHGHCIRSNECPGPSIYSEDPYKFLRPYARVSSTGHNLALYTDSERDFKGSDGLHRDKKFFPANSIRAKDIEGLADFKRHLRRV
ncbi:hypothetical protein PMAYCL1PPCAC_29742, partial [Pristionchus mayeri]